MKLAERLNSDEILVAPGICDAFGMMMVAKAGFCLLYTSPSPRDVEESRMPSSA